MLVWRFFNFGSELFFEVEPSINHLMSAVFLVGDIFVMQDAVLKLTQIACILLIEFDAAIFLCGKCSVRDKVDALSVSFGAEKEQYQKQYQSHFYLPPFTAAFFPVYSLADICIPTYTSTNIREYCSKSRSKQTIGDVPMR